MRLFIRLIRAGSLLAISLPTWSQQQIVDAEFKASVERPLYAKDGPTVAIDQAHTNFHTADGQYKPFADLLRSDGYQLVASARKFDAQALKGVSVLVIANANAQNTTDSAFSEAECDAVRDWVKAGGALLLIADHAPFGTSAANLAARFGVTMGKGYVFDDDEHGGITTQLTFLRDKGLLGDHVILRGRNEAEKVNVVKTFTGQSLAGPEGAATLLKLGKNAREAKDTKDLDAEALAVSRNEGEDGAHSVAVDGRAQGIAMSFGSGRVVVLGEAALFSAQVVTLKDGAGKEHTFKAGMNAPGNDDKQFALNVMHWLSRGLN